MPTSFALSCGHRPSKPFARKPSRDASMMRLSFSMEMNASRLLGLNLCAESDRLDCDIFAIPMWHYFSVVIVKTHTIGRSITTDSFDGVLEFRETVHGGVLLKSDPYPDATARFPLLHPSLVACQCLGLAGEDQPVYEPGGSCS